MEIRDGTFHTSGSHSLDFRNVVTGDKLISRTASSTFTTSSGLTDINLFSGGGATVSIDGGVYPSYDILPFVGITVQVESRAIEFQTWDTRGGSPVLDFNDFDATLDQLDFSITSAPSVSYG